MFARKQQKSPKLQLVHARANSAESHDRAWSKRTRITFSKYLLMNVISHQAPFSSPTRACWKNPMNLRVLFFFLKQLHSWDLQRLLHRMLQFGKRHRLVVLCRGGHISFSVRSATQLPQPSFSNYQSATQLSQSNFLKHQRLKAQRNFRNQTF